MPDATERHAWRGLPDGSGFALALAAPGDPARTRCVLLAEGWDAATAAEASARWGEGPAVPEQPFLALAEDRAACILDRPPPGPAGPATAIVLRAPLPPGSLRLLPLRRAGGEGPRPASAAVLPRCLPLPAPAEPNGPAPDPRLAERVAAELAAGRLGEALAECAAALLALGPGEERAAAAPVAEAARAVLAHLARHPLSRDPALGPFLGALLAVAE
jgi:hypothetical protein